MGRPSGLDPFALFCLSLWDRILHPMDLARFLFLVSSSHPPPCANPRSTRPLRVRGEKSKGSRTSLSIALKKDACSLSLSNKRVIEMYLQDNKSENHSPCVGNVNDTRTNSNVLR